MDGWFPPKQPSRRGRPWAQASVGTAMIAVGFVALATLVYMQYMRLSQTAMKARLKAAVHAQQAKLCRSGSQIRAKTAHEYNDGGTEVGREFVRYEQAVSAYESKMAVHHDLLSEKYSRAAQYPWLQAEPDPPEPEKPPKPRFLQTY
jgi:uncharacterized lipoprotein YddW (UPF0748 family)